jgi:hypothetical protein
LINQPLAVENMNTLAAASLIGDFREFQYHNPTHDIALKLVCWINTLERDDFYKPFESKTSREKGEEESSDKFDFFLQNLIFAFN